MPYYYYALVPLVKLTLEELNQLPEWNVTTNIDPKSESFTRGGNSKIFPVHVTTIENIVTEKKYEVRGDTYEGSRAKALKNFRENYQ